MKRIFWKETVTSRDESFASSPSHRQKMPAFRPPSNFLCGSVSVRYTYANWIVTTNVRELPTADKRQELFNQKGGCVRMRVPMQDFK